MHSKFPDNKPQPGALTLRAKPTRLALDHIALDPRLQSRKLKSGVVRDYAAAERRGEDLPAARVVHDRDDNLWLVDGFHRFAAKESQGSEDLPVEIIDGTFDDALWLSWGANRNHGLRLTPNDRRRAILAAVQHPRWSLESDRTIAQHIGCDHKTVGKMRRACFGGEFPTHHPAPASGCPAGPSKARILKACRLLAKVRPEQAREFNQTDLVTVRAGYKPLHRLLFGASTLGAHRPQGVDEDAQRFSVVPFVSGHLVNFHPTPISGQLDVHEAVAERGVDVFERSGR
jgi:hypothetical protein